MTLFASKLGRSREEEEGGKGKEVEEEGGREFSKGKEPLSIGAFSTFSLAINT